MPDPSSPATSHRRIDPGGVVYGVLAVATVIAAESTRRETFPKLLGASAVTIVLYWLAHAYSHQWGARLTGSGGSGAQVLRSLVHEASILAGALVPGAVLAVAWAAGAGLGTAVTTVLWCAAAELVALEVVPGLRRRQPPGDLAWQAGVGLVMGLGVLALRVVLH